MTFNLKSYQTSQTSLPILGYSVQWNLVNAEVEVSELHQQLQYANFKYLPKAPTPTIALKRALEKWHHQWHQQNQNAQRHLRLTTPSPAGRTPTAGTTDPGTNGSAGYINNPNINGGWPNNPGAEKRNGGEKIEFDGAFDEEADLIFNPLTNPASNRPGSPTTSNKARSKAGSPKSRGRLSKKKAPLGCATTPARANRTNHLVRKVTNEDSQWLTFGLVTEKIDTQGLGLSYQTRMRVFLDKRTEKIYLTESETGLVDLTIPAGVGDETETFFRDPTDPALKTIQTEIEELYQHYRTYFQAIDLSNMVTGIVEREMNSTKLRRYGGVYFVPVTYKEQLEKVQIIINDLPASRNNDEQERFIMMLCLLDIEKTRQQLSDNTFREFSREIKEMQAQLESLTSATPGEEGNGGTRLGTIKKRLNEYRQFKSRVREYAELLGFRQELFDQYLDQLSAKASSLLEEITSPSGTQAGEATDAGQISSASGRLPGFETLDASDSVASIESIGGIEQEENRFQVIEGGINWQNSETTANPTPVTAKVPAVAPGRKVG